MAGSSGTDVVVTLGTDAQHQSVAPGIDFPTNEATVFFEVTYLIIGNQLDIRGTIDTKMLSQKTEYNAYLVFKLANTMHLPRLQESGNIQKMRGDGWMEVKLEYFDSKKGTDGPVEARLFEMSHIYQGGLIVEGVEFRPK
ncbi:F-box protein PP2-B5-like [Solanum stenotomum]|uniref:F-box protein PP2-B5-like n=1 Tax=Solanum stenotomum TaxID=172797 RepID=UPI0020D06067|nr:F-box protein PP2-B5-like [Solanum stenotomum]